jgi:hypothetical protein
MHLRSIGELLDDPADYQAWGESAAAWLAISPTLAKLKFFEHLGAERVTVGELAARIGLPVTGIRRLAHYLVAEGVLAMAADGRISATPRSAYLLANSAEAFCGGFTLAASTELHQAILKGISAFEARFGKPVFEHLKENPDLAMVFGDFMSLTTARIEQFIVTHHHFKPFQLAVDVGGSQGSLLLRLLAEHPNARGILFDLPETASGAEGPIRASVQGDQVAIVGGDFFKSVPAGGDLYLLKQILHDWSDEDALKILKCVRAAMLKGSRLAVLERLIPETYMPHHAYNYDLFMLIWSTGRERRLTEYRQMLEATGFAFDGVTENTNGVSVLEAVAI